MSVEFKFTGDADQLLKEYDKLFKKVEDLEARLARMAGASRRNHEEEKSGIEGVVDSMHAWAATYFTVQGAIQLTTTLLNKQRDAANEAAQAGRDSEFNLASLGVFDNFEELVQMSKDMHERGIGKNIGEAGQFVNTLAATDMLEHKDLFADIAASGLIPDVTPLAEAASALQQSLGKEEVGDMRGLLSKMIHAGAIAPGGAQDVALAAAAGGGSARTLGLSDEELFAAVSVAGLGAGNAAEGGTQIAAFLKTLEMKGFEGKSLRESVEEIDAMKLEGEEAFKYFGRIEAIRGFRALSNNLEQLDQFTGEMHDAAQNDLVGQRVAQVLDNPNLAAARGVREAEGGKNVATEQLGSITNVAEALAASREAERQAEANAPGLSTMGRWMVGMNNAWESTVEGTERYFGGDEAYIRNNAQFRSNETERDAMDNLDTILGVETPNTRPIFTPALEDQSELEILQRQRFRALQQVNAADGGMFGERDEAKRNEALEVLRSIERKIAAQSPQPPGNKVVVRAGAGLNVHQE